ncbi:unnamed protein product, partial [Rangifer tarandus platyrhynchus]
MLESQADARKQAKEPLSNTAQEPHAGPLLSSALKAGESVLPNLFLRRSCGSEFNEDIQTVLRRVLRAAPVEALLQ